MCLQKQILIGLYSEIRGILGRAWGMTIWVGPAPTVV